MKNKIRKQLQFKSKAFPGSENGVIAQLAKKLKGDAQIVKPFETLNDKMQVTMTPLVVDIGAKSIEDLEKICTAVLARLQRFNMTYEITEVYYVD